MGLHYKITTKNKLCIIVFTGTATRDDGVVLTDSLTQLLNEDAGHFVIFLKDIIHFEVPLMREFTLFQQEIRKNHPALYIVVNHAATRELLIDKAVVRTSETKKSLEEVLELLARK